jgi:FkbM family methyltransferase
VTQIRLLRRQPVLFTALKALCRSSFRGGDRLFALVEKAGLFQGGVLRYPIDATHAVHVPISRRWDRLDLIEYEKQLISIVAAEAHSLNGEITLVDCGADVGLFAALLLARIGRITEVAAFEPSDETFPLLERTLAEQPCRTRALKVAVGNFIGSGELRFPEYDPYETGRYVIRVEHGGFPVTTLDAVLTEPLGNAILKIDVEGAELAVIEGARQTIHRARDLIVTVEAHPKVALRSGVDPTVVLSALGEIRPFDFVVAEAPGRPLDLRRRFFDQFDATGVYNVVCRSRPR